MENNCVLDETKQILEAVYESNEKVSALHENLEQNNVLRQQLDTNLEDLRITKNKHLVELEDNENLKGNIKANNQHFLRLAQQIYCGNQELCSDFNLHNSEIIKNEELLKRNNEVFEENIKEFQRQEAELKEELELINKEDEEDKMRTEMEAEELTKENEVLVKEIKKLDEKIGDYEDSIKKERSTAEDGNKYEKIIENLRRLIYTKENEISEFSKLLNEMKQFREGLDNDGKTNIAELDLQIEDSETTLKESRSTIDTLHLNIHEVSKTIKLLTENTKDKENECNNAKKEINDVEMNLKIMEEKYERNQRDSEMHLLHKESLYKQQQELREKIELDIRTTKDKIGDQQEQVDGISKFLDECKKGPDLTVELKNKEETRKEAETAHQQLKQQYNSRILDLEAELKHGQEEIQTREETNRKLQEDTEKVIAELNQWKEDLRQMEIEKQRQTKRMAELEMKKAKLELEIAQAKSKKLRKAADKVIPPNHARSAASVKEKKTRHRHWDSDSSVEGETRVLSNMIKQKMKMKKATKGSSSK